MELGYAAPNLINKDGLLGLYLIRKTPSENCTKDLNLK